jgi:hypothetical protein
LPRLPNLRRSKDLASSFQNLHQGVVMVPGGSI